MDYLDVEGNGMEGGLETFWNPHSFHLVNAEATRSYVSLEMQL